MTLNDFFDEHPKVAVAFSGGVDSAYLLYVAKQYCAEVRAYFLKSEFQPQFELNDAIRLAKELDVTLRIVSIDVLSSEIVANNPADRCHHCKRLTFQAIRQAASNDGFSVLIDGTNASDDPEKRPGMWAISEFSVLSPLRECGLTKADIRQLSKEAGLFTWDKPAYACLATRVPFGERITEEKLSATEASEDFLMSLGLINFRVRRFGNAAKIQVTPDQIGKIIENREIILSELKKNYADVMLDLKVRE
ncbi:ATP-dependent sacrificial sulfur transferase LarE [Oscillibacter sp. MSJ-31]|uniref:ATP-dependent sacrificial sulfur transferase LarE n=1 Tax=Oscillibacter sp. MSJ-31 TaxID=2841526 RepID=UPI001C10E3C4|nr:ATP-dependent sacrificial sulfur transferase LarE [Oscillibacter sp. MSJ-31]MBU5457362.1 ATP-dependent sacrificial sulfur transferase LarE [Oscillibacter sp. MSJ-31]